MNDYEAIKGFCMGMAIFGFVVAIWWPSDPKAKTDCQTAGHVWGCKTVQVVRSNGKPSPLETSSCLDGGAP